MNESANSVSVAGRLSRLELSHRIYGESFYTFFLECGRLSDKSDILPVTVSERLLTKHPLCEGGEICVKGQLRSYNKLVDGRVRLYLTVFARDIEDNGHAQNEITLTGYVCKSPVYRVTPFGREITDMLIAVNRAYNKSDYIPCIVWGRNARYASSFEVGDKITVTGRVQSREYEKVQDDGGKTQRTAYEVSVSRLQKEQ
ncbi:MAG: single-stranded DNA-binding protein [Eubacteriales bacterium]|nr:single-stranded DNA-binding protein [Eubacteriales bacterium]